MSNRRYDANQLAESLGLSRRAVDTLRKQGKIPFLRIGSGRGKFLFILSDVENALSELAENNRQAAAVEYEKAKESETAKIY